MVSQSSNEERGENLFRVMPCGREAVPSGGVTGCASEGWMMKGWGAIHLLWISRQINRKEIVSVLC